MAPSPGLGREAFERAMTRGNELLRESNLVEAQRSFLAALQHDPDNVRALALLGLTYFRANQFSDARPIYEELCSRLPGDASHHLNLGLVRLKLGDTDGAIDALEASRRLDPSQGRAVNYLGLAYARAGRYGDAYEAFLIAGQNDLAKEIEPNLSGEEKRAVLLRTGALSADEADEEAAAAADEDRKIHASVDDMWPEEHNQTPPPSEPAARVASDAAAVRRAQPASPSRAFVSPQRAPQPAMPPPLRPTRAQRPSQPLASVPPASVAEAAARPSGPMAAATPRRASGGAITRAVAIASPVASGRDAARVSAGNQPPMPLSELATLGLVRPDDGDHAFEVSATGALLVRVTDRVFCRSSGVYATGGQLDFEPAHRRSRGANTEEHFDHGGDPLSVVTGAGYVVAFPDRGRFTAVILDDDILYLREEKVFAFSDTLRWENGNIPGLRGKLPVVQFRGDGAVAFRTVRTVTPIKLPPAGTMFVDAVALVGWIGRVVPRAVMPAADGPMAGVCIECTGEGVVLVESAEAPTAASAAPTAASAAPTTGHEGGAPRPT
jgi:Tetratricopeptide repeat